CGVPPVAAMEAGPWEATIVSVRLTLAVWLGVLESVTRKVRGVWSAGAVGVPLICPVDALRPRPLGSVPDIRVNVYGCDPPAAASVCEYGVPTEPLARDAVVKATGPKTLMVAVTSGMLMPLA